MNHLTTLHNLTVGMNLSPFGKFMFGFQAVQFPVNPIPVRQVASRAVQAESQAMEDQQKKRRVKTKLGIMFSTILIFFAANLISLNPDKRAKNINNIKPWIWEIMHILTPY